MSCSRCNNGSRRVVRIMTRSRHTPAEVDAEVVKGRVVDTVSQSLRTGLPLETPDDLSWVKAVRPLGPALFERLSSHSPLCVWHIEVEFKTWAAPHELVERWTHEKANTCETWRKRPLTAGGDTSGPYGCGEVEMAARLRAAGYEAYWISEWSGFPHVEHWRAFCVKRSELKERLPNVWAFDQRLRAAAAERGVSLGKAGGHPDIVAWEPGGSEYAFLEYKGPGDSIKPKQNDWAQVVLEMEAPRIAYVAVRGRFV